MCFRSPKFDVDPSLTPAPNSVLTRRQAYIERSVKAPRLVGCLTVTSRQSRAMVEVRNQNGIGCPGVAVEESMTPFRNGIDVIMS